jgi:hypothetical protein
MPTGAVKKKYPKTHRWSIKKPRNGKTISFAMFGPCSGELCEVMSLGLRLAREAMAGGDNDYAQRILNRVKKIPLEYEKKKLMKAHARLTKKLA